MVTVPTRDAGLIQTQPLPGPPGQVQGDPAAFGGGQALVQEAQATRGLLGQVQGILQNEVQRANEIFVINADRRAAEESRRIRNEARLKKGKNAFGATDAANADFDSFSSDIGLEATNPDQKLALTKILTAQRLRLGETVESHSSREIESFKRQEVEAGQIVKREEAAGSIDDLIDLLQDPPPFFPVDFNVNAVLKDMIREKADDYKELVNIQARSAGLGAEARKTFILTKTTQFHKDIIDKLTASDMTEEAQKYFEDNKGEIAEDVEDNIRQSINRSNVRGSSQDEADDILSKGLNREDALKEARKIKDAEVRDATVSRVISRYNEAQVNLRETTNAGVAEVNEFMFNRMETITAEELQRVISLSNLPIDQKIGLFNNWSRAIAARDKPVHAAQTQRRSAAYMTEMMRLWRTDRKSFMSALETPWVTDANDNIIFDDKGQPTPNPLNLLINSPVIGKANFDKLQSLQKKGFETDPIQAAIERRIELFNTINTRDTVANSLRENELFGVSATFDDLGDDDKRNVLKAIQRGEDALRKEIDDDIDQLRKAGKEITPEIVQKIIDAQDLKLDVDQPGAFEREDVPELIGGTNLPRFITRDLLRRKEVKAGDIQFTSDVRDTLKKQFGIPNEAKFNVSTDDFTITNEADEFLNYADTLIAQGAAMHRRGNRVIRDSDKKELVGFTIHPSGFLLNGIAK